MSYVAIGGAVIGGVASYASSQNAAGAASGASQKQADAASGAIGVQRQTYEQATRDLQPFLSGGTAANSELLKRLGLVDETGIGGSQHRLTESDITSPQGLATVDPFYSAYGGFLAARQPGSAFQQLPPDQQLAINTAATNAINQAHAGEQQNAQGYGSLLQPFTQADLNADVPYNTSLQFGLDEGEKAVNRAAAARGGLDSGADLKATARYATDYAGTKATDAYNRSQAQKSQIYQMLSGQSAQGANTAANLGSIGMGNSAAIGNLLTQQGNANAAGIVGSANALSQGAAGIGNAYQNYNIMQSLTGGGARAGNAPNAGDPPMAAGGGPTFDF